MVPDWDGCTTVVRIVWVRSRSIYAELGGHFTLALRTIPCEFMVGLYSSDTHYSFSIKVIW